MASKVNFQLVQYTPPASASVNHILSTWSLVLDGDNFILAAYTAPSSSAVNFVLCSTLSNQITFATMLGESSILSKSFAKVVFLLLGLQSTITKFLNKYVSLQLGLLLVETKTIAKAASKLQIGAKSVITESLGKTISSLLGISSHRWVKVSKTVYLLLGMRVLANRAAAIYRRIQTSLGIISKNVKSIGAKFIILLGELSKQFIIGKGSSFIMVFMVLIGLLSQKRIILRRKLSNKIGVKSTMHRSQRILRAFSNIIGLKLKFKKLAQIRFKLSPRLGLMPVQVRKVHIYRKIKSSLAFKTLIRRAGKVSTAFTSLLGLRTRRTKRIARVIPVRFGLLTETVKSFKRVIKTRVGATSLNARKLGMHRKEVSKIGLELNFLKFIRMKRLFSSLVGFRIKKLNKTVTKKILVKIGLLSRLIRHYREIFKIRLGEFAVSTRKFKIKKIMISIIDLKSVFSRFGQKVFYLSAKMGLHAIRKRLITRQRLFIAMVGLGVSIKKSVHEYIRSTLGLQVAKGKLIRILIKVKMGILPNLHKNLHKLMESSFGLRVLKRIGIGRTIASLIGLISNFGGHKVRIKLFFASLGLVTIKNPSLRVGDHQARMVQFTGSSKEISFIRPVHTAVFIKPVKKTNFKMSVKTMAFWSRETINV